MKQPLVSLISPCYNAERYIRNLLDSVLRQDYESIEFIVIDDGSTDNSLKILKSYEKKFKKKNIAYHVIKKDNGGAASAINKGLEIFTGDYITFIDADDFLNDSSIKKRVEYLEKNIEHEAVYSSTAVVDESDYDKIIKIKRETNNPPRKNLFIDMLMENNYIWTPHVYLIRSSYFLQVNPSRHIAEFTAGQNIQLFLPVWYEGSVGYIDEPTVTIVEHKDSHSRIARTEKERQKRNNEIEEIYLDTLDTMNIASDEKDKYKALITEKHQMKRKRVFDKIISDKDELGQLYEYDEQKFRSSYVTDTKTANQQQLEAKLIFSSHSLEKSLSNDNFEIGHGFTVSKMLIDILTTYKRKNYGINNPAYINTLSVLKVFYERHEGSKFAKDIEDIFGGMYADIVSCKSDIGGADTIPLKDKENNHKKNFKELAEGRFAVRMYADTPVDRSDIKDAVQIAMKTPTVCNRQSIRVYEMYDKELIKEILKVQGGIAHYDTPPVLLLITANDNGYVDVNERNQGFIDGGLFAMSLLYAFEYKGLAACPLHAMFKEVKEKTIRGMLDLPDSDKLITFMSVGHFKEENNVCKSFRYDASHILSEKEKIHDFIIDTVHSKSIQKMTSEPDSFTQQIRKKIRIRTRLRQLKQKTRIRTRIREYKKFRRSKKSSILRDNIMQKPKGAILTLTDYHNYGNILQRYALQKFLLNHGHRFVSYAQEAFDVRDAKFDKFRNTIRFVEQRIPRKRPDPDDNYSIYISGSDQIWRKWGGIDEKLLEKVRYYFFDFVKNDNAKRIAYAASFGHSDIKKAGLTPEFMRSVKPLVNKINYISVREKSAVGIVKKWWSITPEVVLDPTMLLSQKEYNNLIDDSTSKLVSSKDMFAYVVFDQNKRRIDDIRYLEKVYGMDSNKTSLLDIKVLPPVEQWLKDIRDAKLVVTDSFHGVVFCILNNTPFIVLVNEFGGSSRIETLLSQLGLEGRLLRDSDIKTHTPDAMDAINWKQVNKKVKSMRKFSARWLLSSLHKN